jgi:hypothetical protein
MLAIPMPYVNTGCMSRMRTRFRMAEPANETL